MMPVVALVHSRVDDIKDLVPPRIRSVFRRGIYSGHNVTHLRVKTVVRLIRW